MGFDFAGAVSAGNEYIAQLSNEVGSFISPIQIGSEVTTDLSGTIYCTIPTGVTFGTGYQIRVLATASIVGQITDPSSNIDISCTTRDYYWIGGAGNWSDLNHWEYTTDDITYIDATEVPLATDNVNFDDQSFPAGGQLTVDITANCNDMYWDPTSGSNNPVLWGNSSNRLNVYGDFELAPGVYRDMYHIYFKSIKQNVYLHFGDNLFQKDPNTTWWKGRYLIFDTNGSWDIDSDVAAEYFQSYGGGTIYTNDYQLNIDYELYGSGGSFDAGNSSIFTQGLALYSPYLMDGTDVHLGSINGGTPYINGTQTYNIVTIESGVCNISSNNTFGNLSLVTGGGMSLNGGTAQTITGTFTVQGGGRSQMAVINSQQPGNTATINVSGPGALAVADYVDITDNIINDGFGTVFTANNAVNGGNNTNWSFNLLTPLEYYWINGAGDWSDVSHWQNSSDGGSTFGPASESPGPIDNIHFTSNSFPSSGRITIDNSYSINSMIWEPGSGNTNPEIFGDWSYYLTIKGDLTMDDGVQRRINRLVFNSSLGVNNITMADNYNAYGDMFFEGGGTWNLLDSLYVGASTYIREGTLNTNNNPVTSRYGISIESDLTTIFWGNSQVYLLDGFYNYATTPTINFGTSTFHFGNDWGANTRINSPYGPTNFNEVIVTNTLEVNNSNSFSKIIANPGASLILENGSTQTITSNLTLLGTRSLLVGIESNSPGLPATLLVTGATVSADFVSIKDNTVDNGIPTFVTATNAIDNGGNIGWTLSPIVPFEQRVIISASVERA